MRELGHPMHAHDRGLITGGFRVRFAEPGETVVTLDDVERRLDPADVLIVDDAATAAIGGVMGAGTTEVRETTTDVLLEAAVWDPAAVSRTQRPGVIFRPYKGYNPGTGLTVHARLDNRAPQVMHFLEVTRKFARKQ